MFCSFSTCSFLHIHNTAATPSVLSKCQNYLRCESRIRHEGRRCRHRAEKVIELAARLQVSKTAVMALSRPQG
ncbi:Hypothetical predicted protein [Cloeon dipterum]|uniref:Uncharacterized protein n=1 Tax=Cloeon dipterum TaxID=197152 RepID=A0A8S1D5M5_9INSE|nr:Hypothetical predicted protein [Cloeon dipterum]